LSRPHAAGRTLFRPHRLVRLRISGSRVRPRDGGSVGRADEASGRDLSAAQRECCLEAAEPVHFQAARPASAGEILRMVADEDTSEETPTQRKNDAIRMQKRLYSILR